MEQKTYNCLGFELTELDLIREERAKRNAIAWFKEYVRTTTPVYPERTKLVRRRKLYS
jgi:hypothetical protein